MPQEFPQTAADLLTAGLHLQTLLRQMKSDAPLPDYGWYPYESLTAMPVLTELMAPVYQAVAEAVTSSKAVADIGCADGDLSMLLAQFGVDVDAIDHRESNYNQMRGVEALRRAFEFRCMSTTLTSMAGSICRTSATASPFSSARCIT
jgi:Tellurite resistance protein TehB